MELAEDQRPSTSRGTATKERKAGCTPTGRDAVFNHTGFLEHVLVKNYLKDSEANGASLSKRSQDFALTLFEALALNVARLCQQAVWLWPSFHCTRFATIWSPWQYQFCDGP